MFFYLLLFPECVETIRTKAIEFVSYDKQSTGIDTKGNTWKLYEDRLENTVTKEILKRLPTHNAFWFGYQAAFPAVKLIK